MTGRHPHLCCMPDCQTPVVGTGHLFEPGDEVGGHQDALMGPPRLEAGEVRHQEAIDLLSSLGAGSVQVLFADPPYGIGYHSEFLSESARVLCNGGALYLCCRWDVTPLWATQIPPPLKLKTVIAWVKDNWSAGDLTGCFGNQYEQLLFVTKGRHKLRGKRWSNVWQFPRVPAKQLLHPAQKPEGLVERAISASSGPGDLVVDPFSGSGTTALVAAANGRRFVVGDIDPEMVELTRRRLGWPITARPRARPAPAIDYAEQIEHQFGAPADELKLIAEALARMSSPTLPTGPGQC